MMDGESVEERPGRCSTRRSDCGSGSVGLERDVGGRRRGDVEKVCRGGGGRGRAGIFNLVVNILLALVVCPQSSSLAFCSRPPSGGGSAPASLSMASSSSMIRKRPALLATVGSGTPNLGGGGRGNAVCTTRTGGHSRCVAGGASCKHWEGLSCAEVDSILTSVERYERVCPEDSTSTLQMNGGQRPVAPSAGGVGGSVPANPLVSGGVFARNRIDSGLGKVGGESPPGAEAAMEAGGAGAGGRGGGRLQKALPKGGDGWRGPYTEGDVAGVKGTQGADSGQNSWSGARDSQVAGDKEPSFPGVDEVGHISYKLGDGLEPVVTQPKGRYKILRSLGFGTYGKVVECWDRQARAYCAVKVVRAVPKYRHAAKTEVNILMALQGDHRCVRLLRSFDYRGHICLVFELLGPNLYEVMRANSFKPFSVSEIRILARQVLESLAHTHAKGVVHTDVKPENVLFEELLHKRRNSHALAQGGRLQVTPGTQVKLVDFGSAVYQYAWHATVVSTRHYRAPEIILRLGWSFPCDVWSMGCILYEMYTGEVLFGLLEEGDHLAMIEKVIGSFSPDQVKQAIAAGVDPSLFADDGRTVWPNADTADSALTAVRKARPLHESVHDRTLLDLMQQMLVLSSQDRITAADALLHPFFSQE